MQENQKAYFLFVLIFCSLFIFAPSTSAMENETNIEPICNADRNQTWSVGLIYCNSNTSLGYTLFSPISSTTTYLIDQHGREMHSWDSASGLRPGLSAYILDDGDLLRTGNLGSNQPGDFSAGGASGHIERISWDGQLEWSWSYSSRDYRSHHDIEPMPNGNILLIAWEEFNEQEVAQAGRNSEGENSNKAVTSTTLWPDLILEIKPVGTQDVEIVWEWHAWDHLIQDFDSSKDNYGDVSQHPELLDINFNDATSGASGGRDWMHCNGIDYNLELDQIALSCKNMNEIYIIDHSTTTLEASGHSGGNSGMGGDILYRWGNPEAYRAGTNSDQQLFGQHDVQWIESDRPHAGELIVFNNGNGRDTLYSSVDIIAPPENNGTYIKNVGEPFGPSNTSWSWDIGTDMYAPSISGVERLPNGNTLITYGTQGTFIEVNIEGDIVWKYISPINSGNVLNQGDSIFANNGNKVFKVRRYDMNHDAFSDKILTPGDYIETWSDLCQDEESIPWDKDGDGCLDDTDLDTVTDDLDLCDGFDDLIDLDKDMIPDGCDSLIDSDDDGVSDEIDLCEGYDDNVDLDNDSIPDSCDQLVDSDNDSIADNDDLCNGYDDSVDVDNDSVPDGCDDLIDSDFDGVADEIDLCPNSLINFGEEVVDSDGCSTYQIDTDMDGTSDAEDICPGGNDSIDLDLNLIPDYCDESDESNNDENNASVTNDDSERETVESGTDYSTTDYLYIASIVFIIAGSIIFLYNKRK
ncbi:MAG: aryl-sulfate sulfotransferase [Candidatus Poseidoniaceae archaeon]|nr:aryl-sulfate sulfotransferase [Candidatus Poseidoniaceae archaeon]